MGSDDLERYRTFVERAPAPIWCAGRDGACEHVNAAWLAFTGRALADELGDGWTEGVHPDDRDAAIAGCRDGAGRGEPFELGCRLRRQDGAYRRVRFRGAPHEGAGGAPAGVIAIVDDLDDRPAPDDAAVGAAAFFEMSLDNLCVAGFDGHFERVNPSWRRTLGWTPDEMMARPVLDLVHPDDRAGVLAARGGLAKGEPLLGLVNRYRCKDGSYRWLEWRSVSDVDRGLVYAAARDLTDEKVSQLALRDLTESLTTILNSLEDGVIATDAEAVITRMNPVAEAHTGWAARDAEGRPLHDVFQIVDPVTGAPAAAPVERTIREGTTARPGTEAVLVGRHGARLPIASRCTPMRHTDGAVSGAVLVFRDLTAEKHAAATQAQLQRQLVFADRMASVGTLAAGVAHEINNPLAYVMANLEMLLEELPAGEGATAPGRRAGVADLARDALEGGVRIKKIVRGLKTFSRAEEERLATIEVTPVLELSIDMAFNEIRHRARLVKDHGAIPPVVADEARLGQVFINLLVNAAQALPDGHAEANEIRVVTRTDGDGRAVVEIRDTGPGIPPALMERIFDPFFTTKPIGVGTGLGLWICHDIIAGLGGTITAGNRPGGGAVFRVVLPAAPGRPTAATSARAPRQGPVERRASVLVVDDDAAVGIILGRVLGDHEVTVVTEARAALELVLSGERFDVIVSDLMMPEMSGMELYQELARRRPDAALRMVFVTGGAFTPEANAFLDRVANERLEKPFDTAALRALIQRFLT